MLHSIRALKDFILAEENILIHLDRKSANYKLQKEEAEMILGEYELAISILSQINPPEVDKED